MKNHRVLRLSGIMLRIVLLAYPAAHRHLDRFAIQAVDAEGNVVAETRQGDANADPSVGQPLAIPQDAAEVRIHTGKRIKGARR